MFMVEGWGSEWFLSYTGGMKVFWWRGEYSANENTVRIVKTHHSINIMELTKNIANYGHETLHKNHQGVLTQLLYK